MILINLPFRRRLKPSQVDVMFRCREFSDTHATIKERLLIQLMQARRRRRRGPHRCPVTISPSVLSPIFRRLPDRRLADLPHIPHRKHTLCTHRKREHPKYCKILGTYI
ncbi:hypothetical protein EVAR_11236_1 [Eumeta japonica]|uniref:Uncharacterized protein n=1 Tax=Eumeta variegata TaxID=151549 RepID=A0A4C1UKK8_EUMVA|nr:hypothetical protein EVAR_11236_1 [Eumeta japonica]